MQVRLVNVCLCDAKRGSWPLAVVTSVEGEIATCDLRQH